MILKEQQIIENIDSSEYHFNSVTTHSGSNTTNDEFLKTSQMQFKKELKQYIVFQYPQIDNQQLFCLLSFFKNESLQNRDEKKRKNVLIDDKLTFGSLEKLVFQDQTIIPNDYVLPDCEIIQCLITKQQKRLSYSFIMFLSILKQLDIVIPITAIKLIKQFASEKPNCIVDIGRQKMVYIWMNSNDERNLCYKNDEILLGKDLKMIVHSVRCIKEELIDMKKEVNLQNVQKFLKGFKKIDIIGISYSVQQILRKLMDAFEVQEVQQYEEIYYAIISYPLLILEIQNVKFIAIYGHEGEYYQFGCTYNLPIINRIISEQVDNYQFYVIYQQDQWRIYDGKYNYPNLEILKSKYGTWKKIKNKQFQLKNSDTFRINQFYFNISELKQENAHKQTQSQCYCEEIIKKDVSEIPDITIREKTKISAKSYKKANLLQSQILTDKGYQEIQLEQECNAFFS
ncbi:unnamed protein product [Paramecium octaurelia]|uniref:Uncharacterized protein n=1 Tax=Paramecium octaurelia TaxID=43137 RepID=A0A8S1USN7_PAROT|nr:unnamed protein product [Paramecium octaurelia]